MPSFRRRSRRAGLAAALAALPVAAAYRFALIYRVRAGYPQRHPPTYTPESLDLPFESMSIPTGDGPDLPAWFIPAGPDPGPGVVLVHGWESARDRTLPHALVLHEAGLHVLTFDVRGHGANPPEELPISAGEYAADARAALHALLARPEVTKAGLLGHSMGAAGALIAASLEPGCAAVVAIAAPADPYRLTRQTFRLARLPIPDPIAWPLAWLTTRVYLRPRGHTVRGISATRAVGRYPGPVLLVHGSEDQVVPVSHLARLAAARARRDPGPLETLVVVGGAHSWLYEFPEYRGVLARFLVASLGGPLDPDEAAARAEATPAGRLPDPEQLTALKEEPGGLRSMARLLRRVPRPVGSSPDANLRGPGSALPNG